MASLHGKTILIIEDAPDFRLLTRRALEADGAQFLEASSVAEGIALAQDQAPHLIISDLMMPEQSGFDFLKQVQEIPSLKNTPVLVMSSADDQNSIMKALALGAADYLIKPFRTTLLLQKIKRHIQAKDFLTHTFDPMHLPQIEITVSASIKMANEIGFLIESPVRLAPDHPVQLHSPLISQLGCDHCLTRTVRRASRYSSHAQYLTEINLIGLPESLTRKIREAVKRW